MATWTASNLDVNIEGKTKRVRATLTAAGSYTVGGDNIPAFGAFGLKRNLDYILISGMAGVDDGLVYKYDATNKQILIYQDNAVAAAAPLGELGVVSIAGKVLLVEAVGW